MVAKPRYLDDDIPIQRVLSCYSDRLLADIGLWRAAGPTQTNVARFTTFDVTTRVKADLDAGRATFAWHLDVDAPIPPGLSQQMYFPTVDNTDAAFPLTNRGATICISPP